jgi:hypothetical protein
VGQKPAQLRGQNALQFDTQPFQEQAHVPYSALTLPVPLYLALIT